MKLYSVGAIQHKCRKLKTAIACMESDMPVLSSMRRSYGEEWVAAYLAAWIINVQHFFNISAKMDDAQIDETAYMILDDFWALNVADVNLVFANAKKGQYGQLYGRIDGAIVYEWFRTYFADRCTASANRSIRESEAMASDHPVTDAKASEFIRKLIAKSKTRNKH